MKEPSLRRKAFICCSYCDNRYDRIRARQRERRVWKNYLKIEKTKCPTSSDST